MTRHFDVDEQGYLRPSDGTRPDGEPAPARKARRPRPPAEGRQGKPGRKKKRRKPARPSLVKRLGAAILFPFRAIRNGVAAVLSRLGSGLAAGMAWGRGRVDATSARVRPGLEAVREARANGRFRPDEETVRKARERLGMFVAICLGARLDKDTTTLQIMRQQLVLGLALCFLVIVVFGGWAATAELAGAVIAPARVVVASEVKTIQHPTGGVIGEINVKDGDLVKAGDVLLRLDETTTQANLAIVTKQLDELVGRHARLVSERDGTETVTFPEEFVRRAEADPVVERIISGERALFEARRTAQEGQRAQLAERVVQLRQEIEGLEAQKAAKAEQSALTENELRATEELHKKNLTPLSRYLEVKRSAARLRGEHGQIIAAVAEARGKIAETELQIIQLDQTRRTEVLKELRDIEGKIGELSERKISGEDQLRRIEVTAPLNGYVHQLAVHTVGGVVAAGETLMLIVPRADALTIDAKVLPQDIDQVAAGQPAVVRLSAFNQRTTPELNGKVTRIAANVTRNEATGESHYMVRVTFSPGEIKRLGELKLVPGMPAEVLIQTGERTAMSYFLKPLSDQFNRAFREQ